jgi:hypothetical protein
MTNEVDPTVKYLSGVAIVLVLILMCGGIVMSLIAR